MTVRDISIYLEGVYITTIDMGEHNGIDIEFETEVEGLQGKQVAYKCRRFGWLYGKGKIEKNKINIEQETYIK